LLFSNFGENKIKQNKKLKKKEIKQMEKQMRGRLEQKILTIHEKSIDQAYLFYL